MQNESWRKMSTQQALFVTEGIRYPELVMKLANTQNGIITKQDVIELLKVTPSQAYTVIKKLQGEGRLKLLCGGKYSKYKVVNP